MAAYIGRDVSKLKNKGGKWKYVPSSRAYYHAIQPLLLLIERGIALVRLDQRA